MPQDQRSVSELLSDALAQLSKLVRTEIDLARAEMLAKASRALVGVGMMGAAALLVIPALVLLLMAVASGLIRLGVAEPLSDLISAVIGFAVAGVLAMVGLNRLKAENLIPERAIGQLKRDVMAAKDQTR